jgi:hypothetical protein
MRKLQSICTDNLILTLQNRVHVLSLLNEDDRASDMLDEVLRRALECGLVEGDQAALLRDQLRDQVLQPSSNPEPYAKPVAVQAVKPQPRELKGFAKDNENKYQEERPAFKEVVKAAQDHVHRRLGTSRGRKVVEDSVLAPIPVTTPGGEIPVDTPPPYLNSELRPPEIDYDNMSPAYWRLMNIVKEPHEYGHTSEFDKMMMKLRYPERKAKDTIVKTDQVHKSKRMLQQEADRQPGSAPGHQQPGHAKKRVSVQARDNEKTKYLKSRLHMRAVVSESYTPEFGSYSQEDQATKELVPLRRSSACFLTSERRDLEKYPLISTETPALSRLAMLKDANPPSHTSPMHSPRNAKLRRPSQTGLEPRPLLSVEVPPALQISSPRRESGSASYTTAVPHSPLRQETRDDLDTNNSRTPPIGSKVDSEDHPASGKIADSEDNLASALADHESQRSSHEEVAAREDNSDESLGSPSEADVREIVDRNQRDSKRWSRTPSQSHDMASYSLGQ